MDDRYERLKTLYLAVCDLDQAERGDVLDRECPNDPDLRAEVESLIAHGGLPTADFTPPPSLMPATPFRDGRSGSEESNGHAERIGPYRIIRRIGHGGMGEVYLAERTAGKIRSFVAVKVIKRGMDTEEILRRFAQERQVLAALDNPCIVRLESAGETEDGLPYFALEYVEGVPIDKYCDDNRLSIGERLKLFRRVCAAVQHAHKNQVVHRDLKPGHILLTRDREPKLLDFGIAKLLNPDMSPVASYPTVPGFGFMTPEYASPEQVRGGLVGFQSDVYSLGVILYELLTGHRPYRLRDRNDKVELERVICEAEPPRPSTAVTAVEVVVDPTTDTTTNVTPEMVSRVREGRPERLRRRLAGDIDNIVLKTLRKRPDERYEFAGQLGEDIQRHLDGMPVTARPDSFRYRATKFVRRHRFSVAAAAAIAFTLLLGITGTALGWHEASVQRDVAGQRFDEVLDLARTFIFTFHDAIVDLDGSLEARQLLADTAMAHLNGLAKDVSLDNEPELTLYLAMGYNKVGDILGGFRKPSLGDLPGALENHRKALPYWRALVDDSPDNGKWRIQLAMCHLRIGDMLKHLCDLQQAVNEYETALSILDHVTDPDPRRWRGVVLKSLSDPLIELERFDDAEHALQGALEICRASVGDDPSELHQRDLSVAYVQMGDFHHRIGNDDALEWYQKAITIREQLARDDPLSTRNKRYLAGALLAAGQVQLDRHQPADARELFERSYDIVWQRAQDNPKELRAQMDLARAEEALGRAESALGNNETAMGHFERFQSTALSFASKDDDLTIPELVASSYLRIGEVAAAQGNREAARQDFAEALDVVAKVSTPCSTLRKVEAEIRAAQAALGDQTGPGSDAQPGR